MSIKLIGDGFLEDVGRMVHDGASYIDAVSTWCVEHGIEAETGAELVKRNPLIRARLQMEAEGLRLLKIAE